MSRPRGPASSCVYESDGLGEAQEPPASDRRQLTTQLLNDSLSQPARLVDIQPVEPELTLRWRMEKTDLIFFSVAGRVDESISAMA